MCRHRCSHADAADVRELLDARGNIDAVAENVLILENDVAEVYADPEFDTPVWRHVRVAPLHTLLDFHGAFHSIGHALEFNEHAVSGGLDDPALVLRDGGIDQF